MARVTMFLYVPMFLFSSFLSAHDGEDVIDNDSKMQTLIREEKRLTNGTTHTPVQITEESHIPGVLKGPHQR